MKTLHLQNTLQFLTTSTGAQIPIQSKAEWHQPVVASVVVARELEELEQGGGGPLVEEGRDARAETEGGSRQQET